MNHGATRTSTHSLAHRLTPRELEYAYNLLIRPDNSNPAKVYSQAHVCLESGAKFNCYLMANQSRKLSLLFQPIFIAKNDQPYTQCSLDDVLSYYAAHLTKLGCQQILIPIPEVGSYSFITRSSLHFVLLHIELNQNGEPIVSRIYDSNHLIHIRIKRESKVSRIMANYFPSIYMGRVHLGIQNYGDNQSCGYYVYSFIQKLISMPNIFLGTCDLNTEVVFHYFNEKYNEISDLHHDISQGVFDPTMFDVTTENLTLLDNDNFVETGYLCCQIQDIPNNSCFISSLENGFKSYSYEVNLDKYLDQAPGSMLYMYFEIPQQQYKYNAAHSKSADLLTEQLAVFKL